MIYHNCDKNNVFCDKFCDKNEVRNFIRRDEDSVFRVKGKRIAQSRSLENCRDKVISQSRDNSISYLESFHIHVA